MIVRLLLLLVRCYQRRRGRFMFIMDGAHGRAEDVL